MTKTHTPEGKKEPSLHDAPQHTQQPETKTEVASGEPSKIDKKFMAGSGTFKVIPNQNPEIKANLSDTKGSSYLGRAADRFWSKVHKYTDKLSHKSLVLFELGVVGGFAGLAALHPNPISIGLVSLAGGVAGASAIKHFIDGDKLHEKHGMLDQKQQQHTPDPQPHSTKTPLTPPDHAAIKKFMEGATRFDAVAGGQKAATTPPAKRPAARALGRAHSFLARNVVAPTHRVVQKVGDARIGAAGALVTAGHVTEVALHPAAPAVALATLAVVSSSIALGKHRAHNAHKRMQQHKDTPTESAAKPKGVAGVQAAADKTPNSQQHGAEKQKTSRLVKMAAVHKQSKDPTGKGRK